MDLSNLYMRLILNTYLHTINFEPLLNNILKMATIRLKFRPSSIPEAEGTLYYQVIQKRKVRCISTHYHIYADEWDEKAETIVVAAASERKAALALIRRKTNLTFRLWQTTIDRMERSHHCYTVDDLCQAFSKEHTCKTVFVFLQ